MVWLAAINKKVPLSNYEYISYCEIWEDDVQVLWDNVKFLLLATLI